MADHDGGPVTISAILPTRNRMDSLRETLGSLARQETQGQFSYEVIVVDNRSTDGTRRVVEELTATYPVPLTFVSEPRLGKPAAVNTGIRHARGAILAMTDDDAVSEPTWLLALWRCFQETGAEAVGGRILPLWIDGRPAWMTDQMMRLLGAIGCVDYGPQRLIVGERTCRTPWWSGANIAVQRRIVERLGGYDERLLRTQDSELFNRYRRAGVKLVYEPGALVYHKVGKARLRPTYFRACYEQAGYYRAYWLPWRTHHLLTVMPLSQYGQALRFAWRWMAVGRSAEASWERVAYASRLRGCVSLWRHRLQLWPRWMLTVMTGQSCLPSSRAAGSSRMRVLYLSPTAELYGAGRSLLELVKALDRTRFDPRIAFLSNGPLVDTAKAAGVEVFVLPWLRGATRKTPLRWITAVLRLTRWLRAQRIALVHFNLLWWELDEGLVVLAARLAGVRIVIHNRTVIRWPSLWRKWWVSKVDCLMSVTKAAQAPWLHPRRSDLWSRIRPEHLAVIPSGRPFDNNGASSVHGVQDVRQELGIPMDAPVATFVGALCDRKQPDLFLRAAALVRHTLPTARFLIVGTRYGDSPSELAYEASLHELCQELGLSSAVIFTGFRYDVLEIMKTSQVVVLPSRHEALGGVLIEAMGVGTPVIAAHVEGLVEVIHSEVNGFLIESRQPQAYAEAMLRVLTDRSLAARLGEDARRTARERFDIRTTARQVEQCYEHIVVGRTAACERRVQ